MKDFNRNNMSNLFYDFVVNYESNKDDKKNSKYLFKDKNSKNAIRALTEQWYMEDTMYFIFLCNNKEHALKEIKEMLKTKTGTELLIGRLDNTFENDSDCYISQIEDLDYLTKDLVTRDQLSIIVNRKFEFDDEFKEKDYFNLYIKFKDLSNMLKSYYEVSF
ncbi:MAG: hypothetical protein NC483_01300 [Ruminococcus sp.]|nr:hypothetical protein [Ruminococcus sp.]